MKKMTAFCGLDCSTCPIHLATREEDKKKQQSLRKSIVKQCAEQYGINLLPEDVSDCDGCRANTGRIFTGCSNCRIRKCASDKNIESCAFCNDYACEILLEHFSHDPEARIRLDEIWKMS